MRVESLRVFIIYGSFFVWAAMATVWVARNYPID
jgi:hypothetical protein